ncbi:MAG TPA: glycerate kinase [Nitrospira sp.]|jgi:glycerate-2-kinase|nr:glycerate kinase [Nitrospira sp.]
MRVPPSPIRSQLTKMLKKALASVDAAHALRRAVRRHGYALRIGRRRYDLRDYERVVVVGAGKAAATMARAIEPLLGDRLDDGMVVVKYGHRQPTKRIAVVEAGHPLPDRAGVRAARRIMALVHGLTARDLLVVLLSGGASSLMPAPASGLTLAAKQRVTDQLLRCGADIVEVNTVRKHLSSLKGGRLAALSGATIVTLILSDVIGDDLSSIGSGPTAPDPTTYGDAVRCLRRHDLWSTVPASVRKHLTDGVKGKLPDTPEPANRRFRRVHHALIGNNAVAVGAAAATARAAGWRTFVLPPFMNEAREAGAEMGALAKRILGRQPPVPRPFCVLAGGETTVTVKGHGKGGRAQEFALAAARSVAGLSGVYVAAFATDGSDGPTDAAGALVSGRTWARAKQMEVDLDAALTRNDGYRALKRLNCHITTGPTGTNVNDLYLLLVF